MKLGLMIKVKRIECKMRQEDLAKKLGLSQKTISSWEVGRSSPKINQYIKLCEIFGCQLEEMIPREVRSEK